MISRCHSVEEVKVSKTRVVSLTLVAASTDDSRQGSTRYLSSSRRAHPSFARLESNPRSLRSLSKNPPQTDGEAGGAHHHKPSLESGLGSTRFAWAWEYPRNRLGSPSSSQISYKRLRSPDRFLPKRQSNPEATEYFRLTKPPSELSPSERIHRKREDNPFRNTNHAIAPVFPPRLDLSSNDVSILPTRHLPQPIPSGLLNLQFLQSLESNPLHFTDLAGATTTRSHPSFAIPDGRGRFLGSGTTAPMHIAPFTTPTTPEKQLREHESRIALALDVDQAFRVLQTCGSDTSTSPICEIESAAGQPGSPPVWKDNAWTKEEYRTVSKQRRHKSPRIPIPITPFRVLDAPLLRDDFYCSAIAYCYTVRELAVALGSRVYLWSEVSGVSYPPFPDYKQSNYVTTLSFSSSEGRRSILAIGRYNGLLTLWSTFDAEIRFELMLPNSISCVTFKHMTTCRNSRRFAGAMVDTEDLAVGDESGTIWYYSVEWPDSSLKKWSGWKGSVTPIAKIDAHKQQVCGIVWSPDGNYLVSGGNDNACLVFDNAEILRSKSNPSMSKLPKRSSRAPSQEVADASCPLASCPPLVRFFEYHGRTYPWSRESSVDMHQSQTPFSALAAAHSRRLRRTGRRALLVPFGSEKHKLIHGAAVKALAFAPWQPSLLATGGGSNDRCIRFYHVSSGSCLAIINVHSQVTSLIWSKTRREIAATFGFAQPQHPYRIAVFAWPSCQLVVAIPWSVNSNSGSPGYGDCGRALWAISYPGGPNEVRFNSESDDTASHRGRSSTIFSTSSTTMRLLSSADASATGASGSVSESRPLSEWTRDTEAGGGRSVRA